MTYFSTVSKNNGKSALQGVSNTNTTTGPQMIETDMQNICNFCQSHIFAVIQSHGAKICSIMVIITAARHVKCGTDIFINITTCTV